MCDSLLGTGPQQGGCPLSAHHQAVLGQVRHHDGRGEQPKPHGHSSLLLFDGTYAGDRRAPGYTEEATRYGDITAKVREGYQHLMEEPRFSLHTDCQAKLVQPLYMNLLTEQQRAYTQTGSRAAQGRSGRTYGGQRTLPCLSHIYESAKPYGKRKHEGFYRKTFVHVGFLIGALDFSKSKLPGNFFRGKTTSQHRQGAGLCFVWAVAGRVLLGTREKHFRSICRGRGDR